MDKEKMFGELQIDIIAKALFIFAQDYKDLYDLELSEELENVYTQVLEEDVYQTDLTDVVDILEMLKTIIIENKNYRIEL